MRRIVLIVDPVLSRFRFEQSVAGILQSPDVYAKMGIRVVECAFPYLTVALRRRASGSELLLRVAADNYDHLPPRAWWVDGRGLPLPPDRTPEGGGFQRPPNPYGEKRGWLCFPGWREYHDHTSHQGVPWHAVRDRPGHSLAGAITQLLYDLNGGEVKAP